MTHSDILRRDMKSRNLPVVNLGDGLFFVQSDEGKIAYKVNLNGESFCSCADYARNAKSDPEFRCKHIMAVLNTVPEELLSASVVERKKPRLDERFISNLHGKDFVLYAGLLDLGHQRGLAKLEVDLIQYPSKDNGMEAVCRATATSKSGEVFVDIGDANSANTNRTIAAHIIRMASTRAKARVLRDMNNIGMTALEELGDIEAIDSDKTKGMPVRKASRVTPIEKRAVAQPAKPQPDPSAQALNADNHRQGPPDTEQRPRMSEAQKRAIANLSRRRGITESELDQMVIDAYGHHLDYLSSADAAVFIRNLQQSA